MSHDVVPGGSCQQPLVAHDRDGRGCTSLSGEHDDFACSGHNKVNISTGNNPQLKRNGLPIALYSVEDKFRGRKSIRKMDVMDGADSC